MVGDRGRKTKFIRLFEVDSRFFDGFYLIIDSNDNHMPRVRFTRNVYGW